MGKAYSQVLLEVIRGPRTKEEMAELEELQEMIESVQQSSSSLGVAQSNALRRSSLSTSSMASKKSRTSTAAAPSGDGQQNSPKRSGEQYFNGGTLNAFNPLTDIARSALKSNRLRSHSPSAKPSKDADSSKSSDGASKSSSSGKMGEEEEEELVMLDRVVVVPLDVGRAPASKSGRFEQKKSEGSPRL